jgi:hypothetical protein
MRDKIISSGNPWNSRKSLLDSMRILASRTRYGQARNPKIPDASFGAPDDDAGRWMPEV